MLEGTEREVLELLLERPRSPTEVADKLGVSVQTASRNLKRLVEREFAEQTREGEGRGYKRYQAREFAQVFAGFDGMLFQQTLNLPPEKRAILSVWQIPQEEFHPVLLSYLFADVERQAPSDLYEIAAIIVYGSVARGDAQLDSDIDILVIYKWVEDVDSALNRPFVYGDNWLSFGEERMIDEKPYSIPEFRDALDAGSQFLGNVLDEGIVLYDPEGVIRDARRERTGERVPQ